MKKQKIALDYDGTYTSDPEAWLIFVHLMLQRGHVVNVVTMRYASERDHVKNPMDPKLLQAVGEKGVIFTDRLAKRPFCEALGLYFDIWADDNPRAVNEDAVQIWGWVTPEGVVHDPAMEEELVRPEA